jgi:predicted GIY-YIG superfamily endonuclease
MVSDIDNKKALHLYTLRRMAPEPFYVNHTPRDGVVPAWEVQKVDAYNARTSEFTSADVPRHLDLNLGGANSCYWSEDEFRKNKRPHFTASTHSRSAPTSPVYERTAFLEPRDAQYTTDHTASEMAHFLKETAPASAVMTRSDMEDNGMLQRETSVKRGRRMKNTARRVLVSGNKRLPEGYQMPCLQPRDSSTVTVHSEMAIPKVSKSGKLQSHLGVSSN